MQGRTINYGNEIIQYEIVLRPARKTLGIEVHPDGSVIVLSPLNCDAATISEKLQLRANWISRQLFEFSRYERHTMPRQFLSGESHRYLGRQYKLRILVDESFPAQRQIKLMRGEIFVLANEKLQPVQIRELLNRWYLMRAREIASQILAQFFVVFKHTGHSAPRLTVREMRSRWGSLSPGGQMTLNSRLIQTPRPCIEYVIVHELCHLVHRDHNRAFYKLLEKIMPDWQKRKQRLEQSLL